MNLKQCLKSQVQEYLLENPINDNAANKYATVCRMFNIDIKTASKYWIELKNRENEYFESFKKADINSIPPANYTQTEVKKILRQEGENLTITANIDFEVKTLEDLFKACDVDTTKWEVVAWQCKKWDLGIKNVDNKIETKELYSVSAKFKPVKVEQNLSLQKDIILKELFKAAPKAESFTPANNNRNSQLLEISIPDLHIGKLAHREETGDDYDINIAVKRYKTAVKELLSRVNLASVGRILLPIGNDIIQIDNNQNTTTAGTRVDTDGRYFKIVRSVKHLLIETINMLAKIAPVDVVVIPGNHDSQTTFLVGEILDAYYFNHKDVTIFNSANLRKYYKFGNTGMLFTHGDKEKHNNLGMIFAAENPQLWAETKYRFIKLGHLHHNKKINYISTDEYQGFQIQVLPSLSGSDQWHSAKGYLSLKQAKSFLYDKQEGLIGEFTYSL